MYKQTLTLGLISPACFTYQEMDSEQSRITLSLVVFGCVWLVPRGIQSNKIEPKINRTQSNTNRSIGFGNRTKSNIYFAVSSIFEPIEHNRTQSGSILFGIFLLISKSRRTNQNQLLLNGINIKTSKYRTECQCLVKYIW